MNYSYMQQTNKPLKENIAKKWMCQETIYFDAILVNLSNEKSSTMYCLCLHAYVLKLMQKTRTEKKEVRTQNTIHFSFGSKINR